MVHNLYIVRIPFQKLFDSCHVVLQALLQGQVLCAVIPGSAPMLCFLAVSSWLPAVVVPALFGLVNF